MKYLLFLIALTCTVSAFAQDETSWKGKFEQIDPMLPGPNAYRAGSGAPGESYWQQQADYKIKVSLDEKAQRLSGSETITYTNNSPHTLTYLWLQLDQNVRQDGNMADLTRTNVIHDSIPAKYTLGYTGGLDYGWGYQIDHVKNGQGKDMKYLINNTMMKVILESELKTGGSVDLQVKWSYILNNRMIDGGRSGYEYFPEDDNNLYTIAQFFPRMAVYDDVNGWQNKQFLGDGEFALPFGNYEVEITVPADHIVGATGVLQNEQEVLSKSQLDRFSKAKQTFDKPVFIVTEEEARENEKKGTSRQKTWKFKANDVRDFAFATSRKFIWDAQAVKLDGKTPLAMSFYPKEGNPLWEEESTKAVKNTLEFYSERTFDYPYPVAISVHTANIGMEYPMICFNYGRPNPDGTYPPQKKAGMIEVIIHEVGHNFFPMIVNSDERQWAWMDEGLNTFMEKETKRVLYPDIYEGDTWGTPKGLSNYMKGDKKYIRPIMTNPEQVTQLGYNAYGKPSAALTVLRELVMGPELFDAAFKEYAVRWAFKHPQPADFFRTMEDASAVDLDWFWNGWFYSRDFVDVGVEEVKWYRLKDDKKSVEKDLKVEAGNLGEKGEKTYDFGSEPEEFFVRNTPFGGEYRSRMDDQAIFTKLADKNFYQVKLQNKGGLVTPVILEFQFEDGTKEMKKIPAEIWRYNEQEVTKVFAFQKKVEKIILDPALMTGDAEAEDNVFPREADNSRFDQFKKSNE